MITFLEYLYEGASSDVMGKLHELLVTKHLNSGSSPEHEESIKKLHNDMTDEEKSEHDSRAKFAADKIKDHLKSLGHSVKSVHITSKAGDIGRLTGTEESQQENPADIMVKTHSGHHIGYSLKVSNKKNQKVPTGNPGHGETDKQLGVSTGHHYSSARDELEKAHPELAGKSKVEQKAMIKTSPKMKATATKIGTEAIGKIRDTWHESLSKMKTSDLSDHIRNNLLHANKTKTPLYKSSTGGSGGNYSSHMTHPETQYDHLLKDHKNLSVEKTGTGSISFQHTNPKTGVKTLVARHRIKPESTHVVTSLKGSIEGVH